MNNQSSKHQFSIAIDIDGVLGNFTKVYIQTINELWPGIIPAGYTPPDWYYTDKLTKEQSDFAFYTALQKENLWLSEEPLPGAAELRRTLSLLRQADIAIYYITQRPQTPGFNVLTQTNLWLDIHELRKQNTSTIVVKHPASKASILSNIGVKYVIDDKPETVQQFIIEPIPNPFLLDQSWNGDNKWKLLPRVASVKEYLDKVLIAAHSTHII